MLPKTPGIQKRTPPWSAFAPPSKIANTAALHTSALHFVRHRLSFVDALACGSVIALSCVMAHPRRERATRLSESKRVLWLRADKFSLCLPCNDLNARRSEERRVGKECR